MEILLALALATTLGVQGRANANVSMAADGRSVALVWSASADGGNTDIYAAFSRDAGATFSTPLRVNSTPGAPRVGGEQPPRVSLVSRPGAVPAIVVVWTEKGTAGTTLVTAQSLDGGRTFGRSTVVPGTEAAGNRGWEAIAADGRGKVHAIWLDHRELATPAGDAASHAGHAMPMPATAGSTDSVAKAQLSKLYFATLGEKAPAKAITGGVCYCCKTTLAVGADGALYAAWRHVYPGNLRDIAFTVSRDGGRTFAAPVRVSEDKWAIDGCPENGPAMAIDARNQVHLAWPTVVNGPARGAQTLALFYALSRDGRSFTPRQAIPTEGFARHPQMIVLPGSSTSSPAGDQRLVIAWDETVGNARKIVVARGSLGVSGKTELRRQALSGSDSGAYPALAVTPEGVLIAWSSGPATGSVIRLVRLD